MAKNSKPQATELEQYNSSRMHLLLNLLPIALFSAVSILIVRAHYYTGPYGQFFWTEKTDSTVLTDFFSYDKMMCIAIAAILAVLVIFFRIALGMRRPKMHRVYLFMGAYLLLVLLSCLFSDYRYFAWWGFKERFEGTVALLSYMVVLFYIIESVDSEKAVKSVLWAIAASMAVLGILGLFQGIGLDFFRTTAGQKMISPNANLVSGGTVWDAIEQAAEKGELYYKFTFALGDVYQTVFNINYVPFYLQNVLPIFAVGFIWFWTDSGYKGAKKILMPLLAIVLYALSLFSLFKARSASGYFGLALMLFLAVVIFRKQLKKSIKPLIILVLVTALVMGICSDSWWPEIRSKIFERQPAVTPVDPGVEPDPLDTLTVDEVLTGDNWFKMTISGQTLFGRLENGDFKFEDENGNGLALVPDNAAGEGHYNFEEPRYAKYTEVYFAVQDESFYAVVRTNDHASQTVREDGTVPEDKVTMWSFRFADDKVYFQTPVGKETPIGKVDTFGFEGRYRLGSGRGYIWSRSLPMLKQNLLLGKGPDTYCIYFPQHDYAGKYTWQTFLTVTDKPHCMYLDIALGSGVPSLICWFGIIASFIVLSLRGCLKLRGKNSFLEYLGSACFIAVLCFMIVGLFNDSSVSTMPLFYTVLGLGFACNFLLGASEERFRFSELKLKKPAKAAGKA